MTVMEVDAEAVRALGVALRAVAGDLAALPRRDRQCDGLPQGCASTALADLLGNFELARSRLVIALDDLGVLAAVAGDAYVEVEDDVGASLIPGGGR